MLIFKYLSPGGAAKVLARKGRVRLRFGLPKTYNDPYELFLQTDRALESEELRAFYEHLLGEILQLPVSCFSRVPDSVALWAHYAREQSGICLGFDEDELCDQFPVVYVDDVTYAEKPAQLDSRLLQYAFMTGKRRHTLRVLEIAHRAAYLVKRTEWQYERERRFVVGPKDVEERGGVLVADLPAKALRFILVGSRVEPKLERICAQRAGELGVPLYQVRNGRSTYQPFFVEPERSRVFDWCADEFVEMDRLCSTCQEPGASVEGGECLWCSIDPRSRHSASLRSGLSLSLMLGVEKELAISFDGLAPKGWKTKEKER